MAEVVVTGHQLNFLPGLSVLNKIAAADAVIWMDEMQYERHGFVNRNRFSDGAWITVPVADEDTFKPINRVRIADPTGRGCEKIARTLEHRLGFEGAKFAIELRKRYGMLAGLNERLLALMFDAITHAEHVPKAIKPKPWLAHHQQSRLEAGAHCEAGSIVPPSLGLAEMVAEVGGTVWLSGQSGRNYLDERPFEDRGIEVRYWQHDGPNPCALELLRGDRREHSRAPHRSAA